MTVPAWALSLAYWLHMLATVVWIGALASLTLLVLPAARRSLEAKHYADLIGQIHRRLDPLGWFSLLLLVGTGLIQMSANPSYYGFLAIDNRWAAAILIKHVLFLVMVVISAVMTWWLLPQLNRLALYQARSSDGEKSQAALRLMRQETWLLRVNLSLGVLVLALTAIARAS
jgi:uncharacterized membrane protein